MSKPYQRTAGVRWLEGAAVGEGRCYVMAPRARSHAQRARADPASRAPAPPGGSEAGCPRARRPAAPRTIFKNTRAAPRECAGRCTGA